MARLCGGSLSGARGEQAGWICSKKSQNQTVCVFFFSGSPCSCQSLHSCPLFPKAMGGGEEVVCFLLAVLLICISLVFTLILLLYVGGCPASLHARMLNLPFLSPLLFLACLLCATSPIFASWMLTLLISLFKIVLG